MEAAASAREAGERRLEARYCCARGAHLRSVGRLDDAWDALRTGVEMFEAIHADHSAWFLTFQVTLAELASLRGDGETAARLVAAARVLATRLGLAEDHPDSGVRTSLATLRALEESSKGTASGT